MVINSSLSCELLTSNFDGNINLFEVLFWHLLVILGNEEDLSAEEKQDAMFFINKAENGIYSLT